MNRMEMQFYNDIHKLVEIQKEILQELKANNHDEYINSLLSRNEELETEIKNLEEAIKDLEQDMEDNYKPVPVAEQVGISESDFI